MTNKKFFRISLVTALMAGVVALYSCKKDDADNPADEGKKAAQELCDCYSKAQDEQAQDACDSAIENKYKKYEGNKAFEDAFFVEFAKCGSVDGDFAELGKEAAQELCDCFSNAADQLDEMACMMGLMGKYDGLFRDTQGQGGNPDFEDAFSNEFMGNCNNIPDWFLQMWTSDDDKEQNKLNLAKTGLQAAQELCGCFAEATNPTAEQACMGVITPYVQYMNEQEFTGALTTELQTCNSVPSWVWAQLDSGQ